MTNLDLFVCNVSGQSDSGGSCRRPVPDYINALYTTGLGLYIYIEYREIKQTSTYFSILQHPGFILIYLTFIDIYFTICRGAPVWSVVSKQTNVGLTTRSSAGGTSHACNLRRDWWHLPDLLQHRKRLRRDWWYLPDLLQLRRRLRRDWWHLPPLLQLRRRLQRDWWHLPPLLQLRRWLQRDWWHLPS